MRGLARVSPDQIRAEGVLQIARVGGALFVLTRERLRIFHVSSMPDRKLDAYGIALAVRWLEMGFPSKQVAGNLAISEENLAADLLEAGYVRMSLQDGNVRAGAQARRQRPEVIRRGNRKGQQIRHVVHG